MRKTAKSGNCMKTFLRIVFFATLIIVSIISKRHVAADDTPPQQAPLRIFLRGGPKTHGPANNGLHDGPTWLKEWQPLLESRGAKVAGALRFPTAEELENTDVLVMFAADAGKIVGEQREYFEKFLKRGGGIVAFHDAVVTPHDPQ